MTSSSFIEYRFCIHVNLLTSALCSIITPFGFPVDPDVYITYTSDSGVLFIARFVPIPLYKLLSSRLIVSPWNFIFPVNLFCIKRIFTPLFLSIKFIRSSGYSGSIGKYAPPALSIPIIPIIISNERSTIIPTILSALTPFSLRHLASRLDFSFNSMYVICLSS